mgnify:CR=1 FL=1
MTLGNFETKDRSLLILFMRQDCQFCSEAQMILREVDPSLITIKEYVVFNSRVEGKIELRSVEEPLEGLPLLVDEDEIPEVPCLFDPILGQKMMGIRSIEKYLDDTGLI